MHSCLCVLIAVSFCSGDATVLKILKGGVGSGGFAFDINGGGWGSGVGNPASRGGLGGELAFGYTGGLRTPLIPLIGSDQSKNQEQVKNQQNGQGQNGYPQHGHGFVLQGHGSYALQGQGGFPIKYGIPHRDVNYQLYGIGGFSHQGGKPVGTIPQGGNVGGNIPQQGGQGNNFPHGNQGTYIPQSPQTGYPNGNNPQNPQAGYPNQGGYGPIPQNPQPGYPGQGGYPQSPQTGYPNGNIPQNPQAGYPSQGVYIPQNPQPGYPGQGGYRPIPQSPQPGYPGQGGYIPQNPQAGYPSQGGYIPQNPQPGYGGGIQSNGPLDKPAVIDPRNGGDDISTEKPTLQGRRRTLRPEVNLQTTEVPKTTEVPEEINEESLDENAIPEDKE